jgi:hypothetical protein
MAVSLSPMYGCPWTRRCGPGDVPRSLRLCPAVRRAQACTATRRDAAAARRASAGDCPYMPDRDADKEVKHGRHTRFLACSATFVVLAPRLKLARQRTWAQRRGASRHALGHRCRASLAGCRVALPLLLLHPRDAPRAPATCASRAVCRAEAAAEATGHFTTIGTRRLRPFPVQASKRNSGKPLVTPHYFPGPNRPCPRQILVLNVGHGARGSHCFFPNNSREFSVI